MSQRRYRYLDRTGIERKDRATGWAALMSAVFLRALDDLKFGDDDATRLDALMWLASGDALFYHEALQLPGDDPLEILGKVLR